MTTLAADKPRQYETHDAWFDDLQMIATDIIYEGAAVGDNASGAARPLVAGDPFLGFCVRRVDNSTGAAGDRRVKVRRKGIVVIPVVGVTGIGKIGDTVYAADDDTFTLSSTNNSAIGKITDVISSTTCKVYFESVPIKSV